MNLSGVRKAIDHVKQNPAAYAFLAGVIVVTSGLSLYIIQAIDVAPIKWEKDQNGDLYRVIKQDRFEKTIEYKKLTPEEQRNKEEARRNTQMFLSACTRAGNGIHAWVWVPDGSDLMCSYCLKYLTKEEKK